jgi:RNA polymerase sigma factor (sigma-70 family)
LLLPVKIPYSDAELLSLIARGDTQAFEKFYHCTNASVYNAVMVYLKDHETAREIVQIIYINIWDKRESLTAIRSLKDYLFILARNAAFDHFKRVTVEMRCLASLRQRIPVLHNNILVNLQERECSHLLRQSISMLPQQQRKVYLLVSEQDLSYDEVANRMQVSRLTVKRHLELARAFVRKYVDWHLQH